MSVTRAQKMRLGIFVGTGLFVLVGGFIVLAGMKLGEVRDAYTVRYADGAVSLSGLEVGSPVKYSGIRVGRVDTIRIDPKDVGVVLVGISLNGGTPVAEDSLANLGSMGITGLKYIELTRGSSAAEVRKPGADIPAGKSALDDLSNQAGQIASKVAVTLDRLNTFIGPAMQDRVASVLDRTDKLLATGEATLTENRESLRTLSANLAQASVRFEGISQRMETLIDEASPDVKKTLKETARTARHLREASTQLSGLMANVDTAVGSADRLMTRGDTTLRRSQESLVEGLADLKDAAEYFRDFSRRVREDPSLLLIREAE